MAVTIDIVGTEVLGGAASASPQTYTGLTTGGSLTNGCVTFIVIYDNLAVTGTSATWDGVPCQLISSQNSTGGTFGRVEIWGLSPIGTHTGNKTFSISFSGGTAQLVIQGQSWTGANQTGGTTTFNHSVAATANTNTATGNITSQAGDAVLAGFVCSNQTMSGITGTPLFNDNSPNNYIAAGNRDNGASSVTMSATLSGISIWAMAGANILQFSAASTAIGGAIHDAGVTFPRKKIYQSLIQPVFIVAATTPTVDGWGNQWAYPYQRPSKVNQQVFNQFLAFNPAVFVPWVDSQWPDITRVLRSTSSLLSIHRAQSLALDPAVFVPSIDNQITLTQRRLQGLPVAEHQFLAYTPFTTATVNEDSWHQPWSEPVRKRSLPVSEQQDLAFVQVITTPAAPPVDSWWRQFAEVPKAKAGLTTANQRFLEHIPAPADADVIGDWPDFVRTKTFLASLQSSVAIFVQTVVTAVPSMDGWFQLWREPPKSKAALTTANQQFLAFNSAVFTAAVDGWWRPFVEVPKPKSGLAASNQQFLAFTESAPFTETVSEDRWHSPWSEPVRTKQALAASQQLATAYSPFVVAAAAPPTDGWVNPFGVVPKGKVGLPTANQQFLAFVEASPFTETITEDRWHQPWSEPVRYKIDPKRAIALAAQYFAFNPRQPDVSFGYYRPFSEPVRFRRFETAYQVALARNTFVPTPIAGAVLDVTETGDVFNGTLYAFNAPVACYVSIIQNDPHISGYAGIIEN